MAGGANGIPATGGGPLHARRGVVLHFIGAVVLHLRAEDTAIARAVAFGLPATAAFILRLVTS